MVTEEQYRENLRQQAEDILRSWGWVKKPDGSWGEPEPKKKIAKRRIRRKKGI